MLTFNRFLAAGLAALVVIVAGLDAAWSDEIGPNDFRISFMGPDGDTNYAGGQSAVAYNSVNDEFFVVWSGNDDVDGLDSGEVFGQRIDAKTGELLGSRVRLSDMGETESDTDAGITDPPGVAYDSQDNQYLVVWSGDDIGGGGIGGNNIVDGKYEVYGQRVNAATGEEIGDDFRISEMGTDDSVTVHGGRMPAVVYNSVNNDYLVVWIGYDASHAFGDSFGRLIGAGDGSLDSQKVLRVPDPANEPMGNTIEMTSPQTDVAYNPVDNEYFVVFRCDCFGEEIPDGYPGFEIFGQRLDATAEGIGLERRISDAGGNETGFSGQDPSIAFNTRDSEYLTVWTANDATNKIEVYGQRLSTAGDPIGTDDFRISFSGPDADADFGAGSPDLAYNSINDEFLVVWYGQDDEGGLVENETEIFGQRVEGAVDAPAGDPIGSNFRLSDMNGIGTPDLLTPLVAVAYNSTDNISLVTWFGTDDVAALVALEVEVFGQLVTFAECGNGLTEADEACDDANAEETDACLSTCVAAACGDGFVQTDVEACDGGEGCADNCTLIPEGTGGGTTTGGGSGGGTGGSADGEGDGGGCALVR
jgi:cysteine-rich repeat protein